MARKSGSDWLGERIQAEMTYLSCAKESAQSVSYIRHHLVINEKKGDT